MWGRRGSTASRRVIFLVFAKMSSYCLLFPADSLTQIDKQHRRASPIHGVERRLMPDDETPWKIVMGPRGGGHRNSSRLNITRGGDAAKSGKINGVLSTTVPERANRGSQKFIASYCRIPGQPARPSEFVRRETRGKRERRRDAAHREASNKKRKFDLAIPPRALRAIAHGGKRTSRRSREPVTHARNQISVALNSTSPRR